MKTHTTLEELYNEVRFIAKTKVELSPTVAPCDVAVEITDELNDSYTTRELANIVENWTYDLALLTVDEALGD